MTVLGTLIRRVTIRAAATDVAIGVLAFVVFDGPFDLRWTFASTTSCIIAALAIAIRRISPTAAMLAAVALGVSQVLHAERPSLVSLAVFVVIGTTALVGTLTEVVLAGVLALAAGIGTVAYLAWAHFAQYTALLSGPPEQVVLAGAGPIMALLGTWAVCVAVRAWRSRARESMLRAEAEAVADRAVVEVEAERIRSAVARDVHDVVGHSLAVIIAQADSVPFLRDESRVREVSATIAATARSSLVEVRQVLGQIEAAAVPGSLDDVVAGVRDAGVRVERDVEGTPRPLPDDAAIAARRILQEMLTNAMRHGTPGAPVHVLEAWGTRELTVRVTNGAAPDHARGAGAATAGGGRGIPGMRERLTQIGGTLDVERDHGSFTVTARLPTGGQAG